MIEFDVDISYLLECDELDKVVLNDENGEHEPMEFVPETKYLMALDEAREASKDAERWERIARDRKSMCESLKETNADLRKIIKRIKED